MADRFPLALQPDHPTHNYRLASVLARLGRPFSVGRPYLERLLGSSDRQRYLRLIRTDCDLHRWRSDPAFFPWLARFEQARGRS